MFKYNSNTKIITTDDIILSGDNTTLGESLTDTLSQNISDIEELKANVKWLSMHGGSGSGGSGGGGSSTDPASQPSTFNLTASYTDINGNTLTDQGISDGGYILAAKGARITFTVTKTTLSANSINYVVTAVGSDGTSYAKGALNTLTNSYTFTITPTENIQNITVTVPGYKPKFARSQTFSIYVKIVDIKQGLQDTSDPAQTTMVSDIIDITKLNNSQYTLINEVTSCHPSFEVTASSVTIQDTLTEISTEVPSITGSTLLNYFKQGYGIYTIIYRYTLQNTEDGATSDSVVTKTYVYKDETKVFVLCTGTIANSIYASRQQDTNPISYNTRNVILTYKIYGKNVDTLATRYAVTIEEDGKTIVSDKSIAVSTNTGQAITNTNTSDTVIEKKITFRVDGEEFNYYIYLGKVASNFFILRTVQNGVEKYCYNAVHSDTELGSDTDGTIQLPDKEDRTLLELSTGAQMPIWAFTQEQTFPIKKIATKSTLGSDETTSLYDYIVGANVTEVTANADGLLCIGWKNNVTAATQVLFTITSADGTGQIKVYNDKIQYDKSAEGYSKVSMPKDDEFHLISFYFKSNYKGASDTSSRSSFVIYIDGVQETIPLETGITIQAGVTLTIPATSSYYNFFGFTSFNRGLGEGNLSSKWPKSVQSTLQRYLDDFDPIIPANYYAQYTQTFKDVVKYVYDPIDVSTYTLFSRNNNWVNYLKGSDTIPDLKKFIDINDTSLMAKLAEGIPMYKIVPTSESGTSDTQPNLNKFVYNTMTSYGENEKVDTIPCELYVYKEGGWKKLIEDSNIDNFNGFQVKYQGSSTLLYSVKNFEISTIPYKNEELNTNTYYYFSPNSEVFPYLEQSYNLKADLVDSSTSTNNVIGNVVNEYLTSPFNKGTTKYKCCLSGMPVLLFMGNEVNNTEQNEFYLGVYNWNLNRDSWQHLGYQEINAGVPTYENSSTAVKYCAISDPATQITVRNFRAAEIQGNSSLFDFSQWDDGILQDKMLGDFKVGNPVDNTITENYSSNFSAFIRDFSRYVRDKIAKTAFYTVDYSDIPTTSLTVPSGTYYIMNEGEYQAISISENTPLYELDSLSDTGAYHKYTEADNGALVAYVSDGTYQFKELFVKDGENYAPYTNSTNTSVRIAVMQKDTTPYSEDTTRNIVEIESAVKYYMICMAFAMVDSVQKNLNIKTAEWSDSGKITWVPAFYDMDTALGVTNSGGESDFKAFSNYIDNKTVIGDYAPENVSKWFDIPSSYLFLYAKYDELLNQGKTTNVGSTLSENIPYIQWKILRGVYGDKNKQGYGILKNADFFCDTYLDAHLAKIHPLLMNLNYMYKYFSLTKNTGGTSGDTEESRFHGTMKAYRRAWLNSRLHFLDAMFGISNGQLIGKTGTSIVTTIEASLNSDDIYIQQSMYPQFKKGVTGAVNVTVEGPPLSPLIFKRNTDAYQLYVLDGDGKGNIQENISSNVDLGFYGSKVLTQVSDHGQFLVNPQDSNTIVNDQISEIVINHTNNTTISLDLKDIPNCKKILLQSSKNTVKDLIISSSDDTKVLEEVIINNITAENIIFKNCTINNLTFTGTCEITSTFTFDTVTIGSYKEASTMKIKRLEVTNSSFVNDNTVTFTSITLDSSYKLNSVTFKDNLTVNYQALGIEISTLISNSYKGTAADAIPNALDGHAQFRNQYIYRYNTSTFSIKGTIKVNAFYLNSCPCNINICSLSNLEYHNDNITSISIEGEDTWAFYSFPGLKGLKTCTHNKSNDGVKLWEYGVAWSPLNAGSFKFKIGNGKAAFLGCISAFGDNQIATLSNIYWEGYKGRVLDMSYIHALPNHSTSSETGHCCDTASNYYTLINTLYTQANTQGVTQVNLCGAFMKNHFSGGPQVYEGISGWGKNNMSWLGSWDKYVNMLKQIFDSKHNGYTDGIFIHTAFNVLPKELSSTLTRYHSHLGSNVSSSSNQTKVLIEEGALTSCTHFYSQHDDGWLSMNAYYYNWTGQLAYFVDSSSWTSKSIEFVDQFPKLEYIYANIKTGPSYPVSFSKGNSPNLKTMYGIFGWQNGCPYMLKGENFLNNLPPNITTTGNGDYEFCGEGCPDSNWTGEYAGQEKQALFTNIYNMLFEETSSNSSGIQLKPNAIAILPRNISWDHHGFGFAKTCTWDQLKKILKWLQTNEAKTAFNGTIGKFFHDCWVSVPSGTNLSKSDITSAFKGALFGYTATYRTFQYFHLMDANNNQLPIDITDIFANKEDTTQTTKVTCLAGTFNSTYLYAFEDYSRDSNPFGISPNSTSYLWYTFGKCFYKYTNTTRSSIGNTACTALTPYSQQSYPDWRPIFPPNFFDFVGQGTYTGQVPADCAQQNTAQSMFGDSSNCSDSTDRGYLRGYLPDTDNMCLAKLLPFNGNCASIFSGIIIDYKSMGNNYYRLFPKWYTECNFLTRFNVIAPLPMHTSSNKKTCLFEDISNTIPAWNYLPIIIKGANNTSVSGNITNWVLYLDSAERKAFPTPEGTIYAQSVPIDLAYTLNLTNPYLQEYDKVNGYILSRRYDTASYWDTTTYRNRLFHGNYSSNNTIDKYFYGSSATS